jgi:hypothetical protein
LKLLLTEGLQLRSTILVLGQEKGQAQHEKEQAKPHHLQQRKAGSLMPSRSQISPPTITVRSVTFSGEPAKNFAADT